MNLNLYNIQQEYISLAENIINNGGELTPELESALQINKEQLEAKGAGYGFIVRGLEYDIKAIDSEIERLTALKSSRNKTISRLKDTVKGAMELYGIDKIETPTLKISFRNSESVEVEELIIDQKWCNIKTTLSPDKTRIKEALKRGEVVLGATLKQNRNLQIK